MANGRCRLHGGPSTGARTSEGIERIRRAATKHGWFTRERRDEREQVRRLMREFRKLLHETVIE